MIYHARTAKPDAVGELCTLPELLERADVVSLHVPLDAATRHLIDARALAGNPLLRLDNVVVMPHLAWLTMGTLERSVAVAVENCRRLAAGESLLHPVA